MSVKSVNTKNLTKEELAKLEERVKKMGRTQLARFRRGFAENEMGFAGRKEGI